MSLGLYDYERRRRRRFWGRTLKTALFAALLLGTGLFSYQMGIEQVKGREIVLREEASALERRNAELERHVAGLQEAVRTAEVHAEELETRLQRELPHGELARLSKLVAERMAAGVDPNRLAFVIGETSMPQNCEGPETKRFILPTPSYRGTNTAVGFGNGAVTVSGEGSAARSAQGQPEGWFDPQQPVTIRFTEIGGRQHEVSGLLPLQRSVVAGTMEHRFTISAGSKSFVEVTALRCPFP